MGQYRLESIAQLCRQMRFTPIPRRLQQLDAVEGLLLKLSPRQAYSPSEITFAITGFAPKLDQTSSITGEALQHDLGLLLEEVSDSLQLHVNSSPEPILTIEDVAQRLSVTSKTVQRWRRRGLPARRYTFADGKRRVGFRTGSIQHFVHSPSGNEEVQVPENTGKDLNWLKTRASNLAAKGYWQMLAAQRLASACGLTALAVVQILREHAPELRFATEPDAETRSKIVDLRQNGCGIRELAGSFQLPCFGIYRIVLEKALNRAARKPIRFHDDPLYHQDTAGETIEQIVRQDDLTAATPESRVPRDLPPYLRDLYRIPPMSETKQRGLFLKYNFLRMQAATEQKSIDLQSSTYRQLRKLDKLRQSARCLRSTLAEAHLRLVVSVARKHVRPSMPLMDLVSEGNVILLRAIDGFDIHRGHKFSTYAVYALMRGFARYVPASLAGNRHLADPEQLSNYSDAGSDRLQEHSLARDEVDRLLSKLQDREREIIRRRFGLDHSAPEMTCRQVGETLNISGQRVVQIEQQALARLREIARK